MRLLAAIFALLIAIFVVVVGLPHVGPEVEPSPVARPIIAQLFADPESFSGRTVEIYGLVVDSDEENEFLIQDVSQRPLRVQGDARVGDQLTVIGTFHADERSIYLTAKSLVPTKVTGGGGCC